MEKKKYFLSWYFESNLLVRIMIGLVLGILAGLIFQDKLPLQYIQPFGDLFIRLLRMIMVPIIFSTLVVGAATVSPVQLGKVGSKVLAVYIFTSVPAILLGIAMGAIFRPAAVITGFADVAGRSAEVPKLVTILLNIVPNNVMNYVVTENLLGIIFFTLIFGMGISILRANGNERQKVVAETVFNFFDGMAEIVMKIIKGVMQYAPFGVFALVAIVFATNGPKVAGVLGLVVAAAFIGYAIWAVVWYLFIWVKLLGGLSIGRFVRDARDVFLTGFVTRSSNGTLPVTLTAAENLGIPKNVYSFAIPLGATINMDGTAIYLGLASTFMAFTCLGTNFAGQQMFQIIVLGTLGSIGTAGVPGAGAIMMLMILSGVGLPVEAGTIVAAAYAMILGIDALLDMGRTALNVTGDLVYVSVICKKDGTLDMKKWEK